MRKPTSLNGHTMDIYARAVEADRLFTQEMLKTMTPEQINRFCFENGFAVPEPKVETMYMVEAISTGDYSWVTAKVGMLSKEDALAEAQRLTERLQCYGSLTTFYITPVLDI